MKKCNSEGFHWLPYPVKIPLGFLLALFLVCFGLTANAQTINVTGTVEDPNGDPVIGATVSVDGTKNIAITDIDGNFTLKGVKSNATLKVSYIGYNPAIVKVDGQTSIKITLEESAEALEEVVVVGYGTTRARRDLTGSVGSVSGVKLAAVPVTSAAVALQGKVAGVQVTTVDGQPGADINIRVRGATSVTQSNDPLYIVDGFQTDNINDIPPSDIQSIDILKDASLTAIYGAKGGNGVVIVTTKSAQSGKVSVSLNAQGSVSHISKQLDLMDAYDFVDYQWDAALGHSNRSSYTRKYRFIFGHPYDMDIYKQAPSHDWQNAVMGNNPFSYSTNLAIGGGNETTRFNISLTQSNDDGIILGTGVRRTNILTKLQTKILPNLTLQFNPKMSYRRDVGAGGDRVGTGGIIDVLRYRPTGGIREFGTFWPEDVESVVDAKDFALNNPVSDIATNQRKRHTYAFTNQASLEYKPIKGLTIRTEGIYKLTFKDDNQFWGFATDEGKKNHELPLASVQKSQSDFYTWTTTASYDWTIKEKNNFYALIGYELSHSQGSKTYQLNRYFPQNISAEKAWNNMNLGEAWESSSELSTAARTQSYFGQLNYNFDHKYLISATFRADGSTMFAPGNQWGYFPSVSGAWVISQENWMKDITWLNELKFRAAIGKAGNNNIRADMWRYLYTSNVEGGPAYNEATLGGDLWYSPGNYLPNPDIKWETTLTRNFAFDIALFNNRLRISPEYYWNTTSDLIYEAPILSVAGYAKQYQNIGQVTNRGFEISVSGDILRGKDYVLSASFNLGANKMKVDKLNGAVDQLFNSNGRVSDKFTNSYMLQVGGELGLIYGFQYDGLYSFDEFDYDIATKTYTPKEGTVNMDGVYDKSRSGLATLPGKPKFKDRNGDGKITEDDRTVIGRTTPKLQGGFGLSGQWRDFDFTANFTYFLDFDVYNATAYMLSSGVGNTNNYYNVLSEYKNRWRYHGGEEFRYENLYGLNNSDFGVDGSVLYEEKNAGMNRWNPSDVNKFVTLDKFVEDGSFLRCTDITVGYSLPNKIITKARLSKCRFYASVTNPFIITSYSGYDPEVDVQSGLTPSWDYNRYPRSRSYILGINLSF